MKLSSKNIHILIRLLLLCTVIGTLAWEILERLLALADVVIDLTAGPVGFDLVVLSISVLANPGTILGVIPAIILFRRA